MGKSGISTADLDIVYFVKDNPRNEELRYSLRSICQNMQFNRVWIFGGCPINIIPDFRVRVEQTGITKWDKVRNMYEMACKNKEVTDDFIMFNDDFFVMQPTNKIEPIYRCSLDEHIKILEPHKPTPYSRLLRGCLDTLTGEPLSYELHVPFLFNKSKLLHILNSFQKQHCMRTMYGNIYDIGGEQSRDIKIFNINPSFDYKNSQFISTDDSIVNVNNDIWRWIRKQFPKKCKYEM